MLAGKVKDNDISTLEYPLIASPKIDGIRCLRPHGMMPVTRNFKQIPNRYIRETLIRILPEGFDGEIILPGKPFNEVVSAVMRFEGTPEFEYHAFDWVQDSLQEPFIERIDSLQSKIITINCPYIKYVRQLYMCVGKELEVFERECLSNGYEGVMVRKPLGRYKCGRSTSNEGLLLKLKRFSEDEAIIIGYNELLHNDNVPIPNAFGLIERSTHQANKESMDTLGSFTVLCNGVQFKIGSGFTAEDRQYYWNIRESVIGKMITFKYQPSGTKDRPRFPIFKGFREDI